MHKTTTISWRCTASFNGDWSKGTPTLGAIRGTPTPGAVRGTNLQLRASLRLLGGGGDSARKPVDKDVGSVFEAPPLSEGCPRPCLTVEVEGGCLPSLFDALAMCPERVFVRGNHTIAQGDVLTLPGCCRLCSNWTCGASHAQPSTPPRVRAEPCSCRCAASFDLTGEDFSANIMGAVVLQNASGSITVPDGRHQCYSKECLAIECSAFNGLLVVALTNRRALKYRRCALREVRSLLKVLVSMTTRVSR
jgi:hypothetical protein